MLLNVSQELFGQKTTRLEQPYRNAQDLVFDLEFLERELPLRHVNLFDKLPQAKFFQELKSLKQAVSQKKLTAAQWELKLSALMAKIGDAHTTVRFDHSKFKYLPINFKALSDGVFIRAIENNRKEFLKAKVLRIGTAEINRLESKIPSLIPCDNHATRQQFIDYQFNTYEFLVALGCKTKGDSITISVELDGQQKELELEAKPFKEIQNTNWAFAQNGPNFGPRDRMDFWNNYLKDSKTLYFKYNRCQNPKGFQKLVAGTTGFVAQNEVNKFVVDLRDNSGGNSEVFKPLLSYLESSPKFNGRKNLFLIVGRTTFSSAMLNAIQLKKQTDVTIIGESTSGKPNHFGDIKSFRLPKTNVEIFYSTKQFRMLANANPNTLVPDLEIPLKSSDWFEGKDSFLNAIIHYEK